MLCPLAPRPVPDSTGPDPDPESLAPDSRSPARAVAEGVAILRLRLRRRSGTCSSCGTGVVRRRRRAAWGGRLILALAASLALLLLAAPAMADPAAQERPASTESDRAAVLEHLARAADALDGAAGGDAGQAGEETSGRWRWPVAAPHPVLRAFEPPEHRYGPGHRGIDVGVGGAGAAVHAVEGGTVHFAGQVAGRPVVSVRHADGLLSTYEPVVASVSAGEKVGAGQLLGAIAEGAEGSHCEGAPCLHLGARTGEDYLDPEVLLGLRGPSVLLPWDGAPAG